MEIKEYFEKVMQDYNQYRNGRSLRKYCKDEAIDYNWLLEFNKTYPRVEEPKQVNTVQGFIPLQVKDSRPAVWEVASLMLRTPDGSTLEIKSNSLIPCTRNGSITASF